MSDEPKNYTKVTPAVGTHASDPNIDAPVREQERRIRQARYGTGIDLGQGEITIGPDCELSLPPRGSGTVTFDALTDAGGAPITVENAAAAIGAGGLGPADPNEGFARALYQQIRHKALSELADNAQRLTAVLDEATAAGVEVPDPILQSLADAIERYRRYRRK